MSEALKGRRVHADANGNLHAHLFANGDYGKHTAERGDFAGEDVWYGKTPNGLICNLRDHKVAEHDDGSITVLPSILVTGERRWHGYLTHGIWKEC